MGNFRDFQGYLDQMTFLSSLNLCIQTASENLCGKKQKQQVIKQSQGTGLGKPRIYYPVY